ncbi:MAG: ABC transporter permease [Promethearchaeota archaeon]
MQKSLSQLFYLIKQELKSASRSRWMIFGFILMPILAWGIQGAMQGVIQGTITEGVFNTSEIDIYYTNADRGTKGTLLIQNLTQLNEPYLNTSGNFIEVNWVEGNASIHNGTAPIWLLILENFTDNFLSNSSNSSLSLLHSNSPTAIIVAQRLIILIHQLLDIIEVKITEYVQITVEEISVPGGGGVFEMFGAGLVTFVAILMSVMSPAPFVSASFAGERENKTLEALLALPISRFRILLGKLIAGVMLCSLFAVSNFIGILTYNTALTLFTPPSTVDILRIRDLSIIPAITFSMMLASLCSIGIGIVISCLAKDRKTAESVFQLVLLFPSMIIGLIGMLSMDPAEMGILGVILLLVPFTHAVLFIRGILTQAAGISLLFNIAYLLFSTLVFIAIGAKLFEREGIIN